MPNRFDTPQDWDKLRDQVLGLGQSSIRKNYYPELQRRLFELERFRFLLDQTRTPILVFDVSEGVLLDFNQAAALQLGAAFSDSAPQGVRGLLPPEFWDQVETLIRPSHALPPSWREIPLAIRVASGLIMDFEVDLGVVSLQSHPYGVAIFRDVTERKQQQAQIAHLAEALENIAESVIVTGANGFISYVNKAFEQSSGYARAEAIGKTPRILKSGRQDEAFYRELWTTIQEGRIWQGQFVNRRKDGSLYTEATTITPMMNPKGGIVSFVAIKRDITQELQINEQIRQAQKMEAIGTLAGGIAHDFNNMLSAIIGYTYLARQEQGPQSPVAGYLDEVLRAGERATDLVRQILRFGRPAAQKRQPILLTPIIKEAMTLLRGTIPSSIDIIADIPEEEFFVKADPTEIHQIILNLCTNAYHAMRDNGGQVKVAVSCGALRTADPTLPRLLPEARYARIEVSDTGHGIPKDILPKIFDPYFTTKGLGLGTGLGLATVRAIVEACGGDITVDTQEGLGSTFTLFLPVVHAVPRNTPDTHESHSVPRGAGRVLLVDDEPQIAAVLSRFLSNLGYEVNGAVHGKDALDQFAQDPSAYDLLITDYTMPQMNGVDLGIHIAALRPGMKMLLCSGGGELSEIGEQHEGLFNALLSKPIKLAELAIVVDRVLHPDSP